MTLKITKERRGHAPFKYIALVPVIKELAPIETRFGIVIDAEFDGCVAYAVVEKKGGKRKRLIIDELIHREILIKSGNSER